jgi:acyl transferase domain-containing protein/acyl carrier protein
MISPRLETLSEDNYGSSIMHTTNDIAIVGMSCRFPGANDAETFWKNIIDRRESMTRFSDDELTSRGVSKSVLQDKNYVRSGFVVAGVEQFDAGFFGFTPREAEVLDPQHRLFLECAWQALEHAGHPPERYPGRIGVYAGVFSSTYLLNIYSQRGLVDALGELAVRHANEKDYLATRLSYKLNLTGPSVTVQTSCSTALVAVHMAVQSLLAGECDMALSGGASLTHPSTGYMHEPGGLASPDGHCRPFDSAAQGTVFGDGVGVVLLKRLADAIQDRNTIYAVIKGSAINNDGSDKVGFTAPSVNGQSLVIAEALGMADVSAETIGLVEAHGTGTPLGDPIEVEALTRTWRTHTDKRGYCALGSVKSNIGHLGAAAGIAGLMKAALALHHRTLAPTINFTNPNPNIDFASSPFFVNAEAMFWPTPSGHPRRAAVSSFGMGGTNAHVVLEESPDVEGVSAAANGDERLHLSARSEAALMRAVSSLGKHLQAHPSLQLSDVAYTLREGRRDFKWRAAFAASNLARAAEVLERGSQQSLSVNQSLAAPEVAFLFPGQGSQYAGACQGLYAAYPRFREHFDSCCSILLTVGGPDLRSLMSAGAPVTALGGQQLNDTAVAQSTLFVLAFALAKLLQSMNVQPAAMVGHSVGEYVAATLAGVFTLEDALRLVAVRGRLMQSVAPGKMLSVSLSEADLQSFVYGRQGVDVAAINGPAQCVVAGPAAQIAALNADFLRAGVVTRNIITSHAFHSSMMDPILDEFARVVAGTTLRRPTSPYVSNVTGDWVQPEQAVDPQYWTEHIRKPVRFDQCARLLLDNPNRVLVEVGPNTVLTALVRLQPNLANPRRAVPLSRHAKDSASDQTVFGNALAQLWTNGVALTRDEPAARRIQLPTYPFERERYWIERTFDAPAPQQASASVQSASPAFGRVYRWRRAAPEIGAAVAADARWLLLGSFQNRVGRAFSEALNERGLAWRAVEGPLSEDDAGRATHVVFFADELSRMCPAEQYARQLTAQATPETRSITVVTLAAQNTAAALDVASNAVPLLGGIADFIPRYPQCSWLSLDVALPEVESAADARLSRAWIDEVRLGESARFVAWRGRQRYVLGAVPALAEVPSGRNPRPLDPNGHFALTSRSPAVALTLASALQAQGVKRFTFVFGSGISSWEDLLAVHDPADEATLEALSALLESDAELSIHPAANEAGDSADLLNTLRAGVDIDAIVCVIDDASTGLTPSGDTIRLAARARAVQAASLADVTIIVSVGPPAADACLAAVAAGHSHVLLNAIVGEAPPEAPAAMPVVSSVSISNVDVEAEVIAIWKLLFGFQSINIDDDFFAVGGTSLVAIQLISRIRDRFGVELSIETLFEDPTVRGVAAQVKQLLGGGNSSQDAELRELPSASDQLSLQELRASAE